MNKAACAWLVVIALLGCRPAAEQRPSTTANAPSAPSPSGPRPAGTVAPANAQRLAAEPACNPDDEETVFLARSPAESRALRDRLARGPVAVRYSGCKVEFLSSCQVSGSGTIAEASGCCASDAGCRGNHVDCYGSEERYWFGTALEWQLNLPETLPRWSMDEPAALVVGATVHAEYRAACDVASEASCAGATHVITRARFGSLRVDAEAMRHGQAAPTQTAWVAPPDADTLIDVTLSPVGAHRTGQCMGLTTPRAASEPPAFLGERYRSLPRRCYATCQKGSAACPCAEGFGEGCAGEPNVDSAELKAVCDFGGDQSALACAKLSTQVSGEASLEAAWTACERGREKCDLAAQLLATQNLKTGPRLERALRMGCASGGYESCCAWGALLLAQGEGTHRGHDVLNQYCSESVQSCCATLRSHGYSVPQRRKQPD